MKKFIAIGDGCQMWGPAVYILILMFVLSVNRLTEAW